MIANNSVLPFVQPLNNRIQDVIFKPTHRTKAFDLFTFKFLKNYVYQLFRGALTHPEMRVLRMLGVDTGEVFSLHQISLTDDNNHIVDITNNSINATVLYQQSAYELCFITFPPSMGDGVSFMINVMGLQSTSVNPSNLIKELERCSLENSSYKNKVLCLSENANQAESTVGIEILKLEKMNLSDIFISADIEMKLKLFIDCVNNFSTVKKTLRYLFNGKPGTGKTRMIRAIANSVKGNTTLIMANGSDVKMSRLFEFAKKFSPVVVCIDDVDLLVGNREERSHSNVLGKFLQYLDGFIDSDMFILATTNDKTLVDMAASRPGRFDLIVDIQSLSPTNYLKLVENKASVKEVVSLFDDSILNILEARKVTGAFISTLVKHLELCYVLRRQEFTREYILNLIDDLHQGFYKNRLIEKQSIGYTQ